MIRLAVCPSCGQRLSRRFAFMEKAFRCPGCGVMIRADSRSIGMALGVGLFLVGIGFYVAFLLGYAAYWEFLIAAAVVLLFFVLVFPYVQGFVQTSRGPVCGKCGWELDDVNDASCPKCGEDIDVAVRRRDDLSRP